MEKIDFVLLWVDGNDSKWREEKNKYLLKDNPDADVSDVRYRDWDILHYWFRGVEKYAPWVNKIFFVTYGHLPPWLDTNNPKLEIVKHEDFIPKEYLPTFNSCVIVLNLHRIKGLSEKFVLFNDDMFLLDHVKDTDFFDINGLPRDNFSFNVNTPFGNIKDIFPHRLLNNIIVVNKHYSKKLVIKKNFFKLFNAKNGIRRNIQSIVLSLWPRITGFDNPHMPYSYSKKYFYKLWNEEFEILDETSKHKFRTVLDVTDWLVRYFQLCDGYFKPRKYNFGKYFELLNDNEVLYDHIKKQKSKMICINDVTDDLKDPDQLTLDLKQAFDTILDEKSSFEL